LFIVGYIIVIVVILYYHKKVIDFLINFLLIEIY
jgi:hypothetical protein